MEVRRLFVCVDPSADALAHLGAVVDGLEVSRANVPGHSTRMAARDRWHVTLAFLGDVKAHRVGDVARAMDRAWTVDGPVLVRFAGGGVSGRGRRAILWAGLGGDVDSLRTLVTAIRQELRRARLPYDARPFRPHLTISRVGDRIDPDQLAKDAQTLGGYVGPPWTIDSLQLVASELGPRPVYTTLHRTASGSAS
jgi:RNA 2',3'-cyclic 3'-phosphodiesterase